MKISYRFEINGLPVQAEFDSRERDEVFVPLLKRLSDMQARAGRRIVAFIAGPPAAGKSVLCRWLELLSATQPDLTPAQAIGIDGFHYPNSYLDAHGIEQGGRYIPLREIKGAPESYDVTALAALLDKLSCDGQRWPLYDRRIHDPRPAAIELHEQILLLEGNWLLLNEVPWNALKCDYSVFLRAGDEAQLQRIVERKLLGGYAEAEAREMVRRNDLPNILRCMERSRRGDLNLMRAEDGAWEEI